MVFCPYCQREALFLTSEEFYGRDYGSNVYLCRPCDAYVGTHKNSRTPLGTMAKPQLRKLRMQAHSLFDPLWKSRNMSRNDAYKWLQKNMNLSSEEAHIGMFNEEQCRIVIEKLKSYRQLNY